MSLEILGLLLIVAVMIFFFLTEKLPVDLSAVLGLSVLILCGYLGPEDAFTGFSSPTIITLISMYFISGALMKTGVAEQAALGITRLFGRSEAKSVLGLMLLSVMLSAFMSNVAVTAVLLPTAASIAQSYSIAPSKLFIPLSFAAVLGGMTTLIGTTPNIIAADFLVERGYEGFGFFEFTKFGLPTVVFGILFLALIGRRLLPSRDVAASANKRAGDLVRLYKIFERLFLLAIPKGSHLAGKSISQSNFGGLLGISLVSVIRDGKKIINPKPDFVFKEADVLMVQGKLARLQSIIRFIGVKVLGLDSLDLSNGDATLAGSRFDLIDSSFVGKTLSELRFANCYGIMVIAIARGEELITRNLANIQLEVGDSLHLLAKKSSLKNFLESQNSDSLIVSFSEIIHERVFIAQIPKKSLLDGIKVKESKMAEIVGLRALVILRNESIVPITDGQELVKAGDRIIMIGDAERVAAIGAIGALEIKAESADQALDASELEIAEVVVAPRSGIIGKNLVEANFREKYDLQVMAVWREGAPIRTQVSTLLLKFGDALLVHGKRSKLQLLSEDDGFVVLGGDSAKEAISSTKRSRKAIYAIFSLMLMIGLSVFQLVPIHLAAFFAAVFAVFSGAIKMEEAYKAVSWRIIVLVAALIPIGLAVQSSGAADYLAQLAVGSVTSNNPVIILVLLCLLSSFLSQCLDSAIAVVLLSPVAFSTAEKLAIEPHAFIMGIAICSSIAYLTPFSHKANLLVMGVGGYRTRDYFKVGLPLTIICFACVIAILIYVYPFS